MNDLELGPSEQELTLLRERERTLRWAFEERGRLLVRELEESCRRRYLDSMATATDTVSGSLQTGALFERLEFELRRSRATGQPLSAIALDLDRFGELNTHVGFRQADGILKSVGAAVRALWTAKPSIRPVVIGRLGADALLILLPDTDAPETARRAEEVTELVQNLPLGGVRITASVGFDTLKGEGTSSDLLNRLKSALRRAKKYGGNRAIFAGQTRAE